MTQETLLVTLFFITPGFIAVQVYQFLLADNRLSAFELTSWALIYSVLGLTLLVALPWTRPLVGYVFAPHTVSPTALLGLWLQVVTSAGIAILLSLAINKAGAHVGRRSFYQRAWDYLWSQHRKEQRTCLVYTKSGLYLGVLYFASSGSEDTALILRNPSTYDSERDSFWVTGAEFAYIPASEVLRVDLSIAATLKTNDEPPPTPEL